MTITVNISDANLTELIARVEAGEEVILSRDDKPVARLSGMAITAQAPLTDEERARRKAIVDQMLAERDKRAKITQEEIAEWKQIGRK